MLELWLIRHGETDWNAQRRWQGQSDVPLNALGRQQAQALAKRLSKQRFDAVHSSDLSRAYETAQLVFPHYTITPEPRLRELNFGSFEGKTWEELQEAEAAMLRRWREDPYACQPPGGEQFGQVVERTKAWYLELPPSGKIAAVAHGGTIRALTYAITGTPSGAGWGFSFDNGSVTILQRFQNTTLLKRVNDTAHLENLP